MAFFIIGTCIGIVFLQYRYKWLKPSRLGIKEGGLVPKKDPFEETDLQMWLKVLPVNKILDKRKDLQADMKPLNFEVDADLRLFGCNMYLVFREDEDTHTVINTIRGKNGTSDS